MTKGIFMKKNKTQFYLNKKGGRKMKKQILGIVIGLVVMFGIARHSHALLVDNDDGTVTQKRGDGSVLIWLKDANMGAGSAYDNGFSSTDGLMTWDMANNWVSNLYYGGFSDWRLPAITDIGNDGCNYGYSGTDCGYNVNTSYSEMAYMFYVELGNTGYFDTEGEGPQEGYGFGEINTGPFTNLLPINFDNNDYWSGTPHAIYPNQFWYFNFDNSYQSAAANNFYYQFHVWAVRSVPEPGTILLLGSGLAGLIIYRKKISR